MASSIPRLVPPSFELNMPSSSSFDSGRGRRDGGLRLSSGRSLSKLGGLLGLTLRSLLSGFILGNWFRLRLGLSRGLLLPLHGLAGLTEDTAELLLGLTIAAKAEERGASALILGGDAVRGSRRDRGFGSRDRRGNFGGFAVGRSGHALGLGGLSRSLLDGVVQLWSSAGDGGLGRGTGLLLRLLTSNLLEEVAEEGGALGLVVGRTFSLLLLLGLFLLLLLLLLLLVGLSSRGG